MYQLPPIYDNIVMNNNHIDGRPDCAPSHWNENFTLYYLTEKMRCTKDPEFSDLCDRVGIGKITSNDVEFLKSRIQDTDSEKYNENFRTGMLLYIVTTNKKRNYINNKKMDELLPNEKEYMCNSIDHVMNVPSSKNVPNHLNDNPSKTGNLLKELRLKIGAPVVITVNHSKKKYREDGIMNGARGYVQSIQVSKKDPNIVEIIWVVFHNESIGALYRFDHRHLWKDHNPGHKLAVPILPQRKTFTLKLGNVEYQRSNFPLSLAYAVTAHKCQGETLDEVIIDYGPDKENNIKNFICDGSFYVALTRVKEGSKVFLKSFDTSYIKVNKDIAEKIKAMRQFRPYNFKKVYLDETIFDNDAKEWKIGYLNINGLIDGGHAEYLNSDYNLINLDLLVLSETKLDQSIQVESVEKLFSNWTIVARFDSKEGKKNMGLMLLSSKCSTILKKVQTTKHQKLHRNGSLQAQSLIITLSSGETFGFIYCRSTPNNAEIKAIKICFDNCCLILGDFNLSHRINDEHEKIKKICGSRRISLLNEITRSKSDNQLDYIIAEENMEKNCYATSFTNFISDHKTITVRISLGSRTLLKEIKERITFDRDSHLRTQKQTSFMHTGEKISFRRRFDNPDSASCWLNSCLQLILAAMDFQVHVAKSSFTSELGLELLNLLSKSNEESLNPTNAKNIITLAEDTNIAMQLSEIGQEVVDKNRLKNRTQQIENFRLNLHTGQQCVRDLFMCLEKNCTAWPDVYSFLSFKLNHKMVCSHCYASHEYDTMQLYIEISVPANNTTLKEVVENCLNEESRLECICYGCNQSSEKLKKTTLCFDNYEANFLVVILSRGVETNSGSMFIKNKVDSSEDIVLR